MGRATRTDLTLPRGIRDIEPEEYDLQQRIQQEFFEVARLFNFKVMEPAPIEHLSVLRAKSGADVDKEIYAFKDKGGRDIGLRFDLTVGMTRYVCSRRDLKPPVKLAALAGAWRYDEPQHARYRWFRQWDLEVFGPPSVEADAEVIEATYRLFQRLGLKGFLVQVGDRSAVQFFVNKVLGVKEEERAVELMRALDKAQKRSLSELKAEYVKKGFRASDLATLFEFGRTAGEPEAVLSSLSEYKVDASGLSSLRDILVQRGVKGVRFNMSVVRGIDYYTGIVFEVTDLDRPDLGSLAGGGRYDLLPRVFGRPDLSATGAAGGMERIATSLSGIPREPLLLAFVAVAGGAQGPALGVQRELRSNGIPAEASLQPKALSKQLEDASRMGATWALILGEREAASGSVTLRDMRSRKEELLPLSDAMKRMKESVKGRHNL